MALFSRSALMASALPQELGNDTETGGQPALTSGSFVLRTTILAVGPAGVEPATLG
jgi:hypothetical protein